MLIKTEANGKNFHNVRHDDLISVLKCCMFSSLLNVFDIMPDIDYLFWFLTLFTINTSSFISVGTMQAKYDYKEYILPVSKPTQGIIGILTILVLNHRFVIW